MREELSKISLQERESARQSVQGSLGSSLQGVVSNISKAAASEIREDPDLLNAKLDELQNELDLLDSVTTKTNNNALDNQHMT